ncbi:MAG: hypothetical protein IKN93_00725 [Bacteroidales bacterium]|nr:hypothetical protein [Bacteroidales bacterium]
MAIQIRFGEASGASVGVEAGGAAGGVSAELLVLAGLLVSLAGLLVTGSSCWGGRYTMRCCRRCPA